MLNRQWHKIDNNNSQYILSISKSRINISISNMENNCTQKQYVMYKSLYDWPTPGKEPLYMKYCFHIQLFSIFEIEMLTLLLAILNIYWPLLLSIICHVQISIVCYCLFNI